MELERPHLREAQRAGVQLSVGLNVDKTEGGKMKYLKPELIVLPNPINAIQNHTEKPCSSFDNATGQNNATAAAYEADE